MRRSPLIIAATVAGTAGVLAFHPQTPAVKPATASTTTTTTPASSTGAGATTASGTAAGDAIDTQYGSAQVRVTVKNGKITAIEALQLQGNDPRSVQISGSAEPILQQEALSKQSADVDAVSGATFTSASYTQSLQSALDKLGFKAPDGSVASLQVP
ncbi:MAG: FMN-binding protein [Solirubrobacteraceae bacterium]